MEAKHSYFKRISHIGNYKNITYSLARRHQRLLCANLQGQFFTFNDLECGPCKYVIKTYAKTENSFYNNAGTESAICSLHVDPLASEILSVLPDTDLEVHVSRSVTQ